jgi:hypothetical protein
MCGKSGSDFAHVFVFCLALTTTPGAGRRVCSYSYYPSISSWQREACAGGDGDCIAIRRPSNDRAALFYYFGWLAAAAAGAHNGCTTATAAFIKRRKFTSATACCAPAICIVCWC